WTGLVVLGLIAAIAQFRHDRASRILLAWLASIFIPLLVIGNRQPHYLLPMMPPLMILVGRTIDGLLRRDARLAPRRAVAPIFYSTLIVLALAAVAIALTAPAPSGPINAF